MRASKPFVHLHLHTEYSLLDGAARITSPSGECPLIEAMLKKNMPAVAITDHGNMYATYTFYNKIYQYNQAEKAKAKSSGREPKLLKFIPGCEFYVANDHKVHDYSEKFSHLILLAKNDAGYRNLVKLNSIAFVDGFYKKPRIDMNLLKEHAEGLICLSACIVGKIPRLLLNNEYNEAKEYALQMKELFGDDFYIELQDHGIPEEQRVLPLLLKLAKETGIKTVATNDCHYLEKDDAEMHDVLLCVQSKADIDDKKRMKFTGSEFYLKTYDEMAELFGFVEEALDNTIEIANKCNVEITKHALFPPYVPETGENVNEFLRRLAYEGLKRRYGEITPEIKKRAEYELGVIISMGFAEYYLIVWDFIDFARKHDIPVGPGRGSGVGSIIAYAIGITQIDPLKYNLIFERFLNVERVSNPDFDIDFCVVGREKVIEYVTEKYGKDRVCQIITFGTLAPRNVFKGVAKVFRIPFAEANQIAKFIPSKGARLDEALGLIDIDSIKEDDPAKKAKKIEDLMAKRSDRLIELYNNNSNIKKVLDISMRLEGMPKNTSKHAAGVVICKEVISDYIPLQRNDEDITTQYTKDEIEELGLLKMDFLGLKTLTDIDLTVKYIKESTGIDVDLSDTNYDDPMVYELVSSGNTEAVFQLESGGMQKFMKELRPSTLEEIIAGLALYRPGPMNSIPAYIKGKRDPDSIVYLHEKLKPILGVTNGIIVYQEQVMQIVRDLAGYSYGGADGLRRIMSKKKMKQMVAEKEKLLHGYKATEAVYNKDGSVKIPAQAGAIGMLNNGVDLMTAEKIYNDMFTFAEYAFNKSHAAAYAVVAYKTAYLKAHYPLHFISVILNNRIDNIDEVIKYVQYIRNVKIPLYLPDINRSDMLFTVEGEGIRYGLLAAKGASKGRLNIILDERKKNGPFKSFVDMARRVEKNALNKKTMEGLIKIGAFDSLGYNRATLLENFENIIKVSEAEKKDSASGQLSLFDVFSDNSRFSHINVQDIEINEVPEMDFKALLKEEKDVAGLYLSGHPLMEMQSYIHSKGYFTLEEIRELIEYSDTSDNDDDENMVSDAELEDDQINALIEKYNNKAIEMIAIIDSKKEQKTKKAELMCIVDLSDMYESVRGVIFPRAYSEVRNIVKEDLIVKVKGILKFDVGEKPQLIINSLSPFNLNDQDNENDITFSEPEDENVNLYINLIGNEDLMVSITRGLDKHEGNSSYFIKVSDPIKGSKWIGSGDKKIRVDKNIMTELIALVGNENIFKKLK